MMCSINGYFEDFLELTIDNSLCPVLDKLN